MMRGPKGPGPAKGGKAKGNDKTKGKDGDSKSPEWKLVPVIASGARDRPPTAQPPAPVSENKPRLPYPYPAVIDLVDRDQERRERQHRDRAEREDNERGEVLKALEDANREKASEIEAGRDAAAREADSAHAAKVADIDRHYGEVQAENSRLDYFANREAIERRQQEAGDRTPTPDRQQDNGAGDRDR